MANDPTIKRKPGRPPNPVRAPKLVYAATMTAEDHKLFVRIHLATMNRLGIKLTQAQCLSHVLHEHAANHGITTD